MERSKFYLFISYLILKIYSFLNYYILYILMLIYIIYVYNMLKQAIQCNELARKGFKATGMHPFNPAWVEQNMHKMSFSQAYSTDNTNRDIATTAITHHVEGYQEAKDILTAKKIMKTISSEPATITSLLAASQVSYEDYQAMINRVSTSQYSGLPTDGKYTSRN